VTAMALPLHDEEALRKMTEFIVSQWRADVHWNHAQVLGICLGFLFTRDEFFRVVYCYLIASRNRRSHKDW